MIVGEATQCPGCGRLSMLIPCKVQSQPSARKFQCQYCHEEFEEAMTNGRKFPIVSKNLAEM